jgi:hypothetical protein
MKDQPREGQPLNPGLLKAIAVAVCSGASYLVSTVTIPLPQEDAVSTTAVAKLLVVLAAGLSVAAIVDLHPKWKKEQWWRVACAAMVVSFSLYATYTFWTRPMWTSACGTRAPLSEKVMIIGWTLTPFGKEVRQKAQNANPDAQPTWPQVIEGAYAYRENLWPQWQRRLRNFLLHLLYIATPVSFALALVCLFGALTRDVERIIDKRPKCSLIHDMSLQIYRGSGTRKHYAAFRGVEPIARGLLRDVLAKVLASSRREDPREPTIFDEESGQQVDFDLRSSLDEVMARIAAAEHARTVGRPRLGVVSREVTLLPRHWDWLARQPKGASAVLRRLVEAAIKEGDSGSDERNRLDVTSHDVGGRLRLAGVRRSRTRSLRAQLGDVPLGRRALARRRARLFSPPGASAGYTQQSLTATGSPRPCSFGALENVSLRKRAGRTGRLMRVLAMQRRRATPPPNSAARTQA